MRTTGLFLPEGPFGSCLLPSITIFLLLFCSTASISRNIDVIMTFRATVLPIYWLYVLIYKSFDVFLLFSNKKLTLNQMKRHFSAVFLWTMNLLRNTSSRVCLPDSHTIILIDWTTFQYLSTPLEIWILFKSFANNWTDVEFKSIKSDCCELFLHILH